MTKQLSGALGESIVLYFLERRGWKLVLRNWRDRYVEIDLVMLDANNALHLIEVKTRKHYDSTQGHLLEMISHKQLRRIRQASLRVLPTLSVDIRHGFCHIDAAFVHLKPPKAFVTFFPDCDV